MIWFLGFNVYILSILGLTAFLYYSNRENLRGKSVREVINSCFHWIFFAPFLNTVALIVISIIELLIYIGNWVRIDLFPLLKNNYIIKRINDWLDNTTVNL